MKRFIINRDDADYSVKCTDGEVMVHEFLLFRMCSYFTSENPMQKVNVNTIPYSTDVFSYVVCSAFYEYNLVCFTNSFVNETFRCIQYLQINDVKYAEGLLVNIFNRPADSVEDEPLDFSIFKMYTGIVDKMSKLQFRIKYSGFDALTAVKFIEIINPNRLQDLLGSGNTFSSEFIYDMYKCDRKLFYSNNHIKCAGFRAMFKSIINRCTYEEYVEIYDKIIDTLINSKEKYFLYIAKWMYDFQGKLYPDQEHNMKKMKATLACIGC